MTLLWLSFASSIRSVPHSTTVGLTAIGSRIQSSLTHRRKTGYLHDCSTQSATMCLASTRWRPGIFGSNTGHVGHRRRDDRSVPRSHVREWEGSLATCLNHGTDHYAADLLISLRKSFTGVCAGMIDNLPMSASRLFPRAAAAVLRDMSKLVSSSQAVPSKSRPSRAPRNTCSTASM